MNILIKTLLLIFFVIIYCNVNAEESPIIILFCNGIITYIDKSPDANFSICFKGDTMVQSKEYQRFFKLDSSIVQINKYRIPDSLLYLREDSLSEIKLFQYFRDYEFDYQKKEIYHHELNCENIYFSNKYSKRFMIWFIKEPEAKFKNAYADNDFYKKDTANFKRFVVEYQLQLLFTANSNIVNINIPVLNNEKLTQKLESLKTEIANSIRIFDGEIDLNTLYKQIENIKKNEPIIIKDAKVGIQFTIPDWLKVNISKHVLKGTFPDINNRADELCLTIYKKTSFKSFEAFEKTGLKGKDIIKYDKLISSNDKITRYKVLLQNFDKTSILQNVFINIGDYYGFVNIFSDENNYDKNIQKFDEFIDSIKLE